MPGTSRRTGRVARPQRIGARPGEPVASERSPEPPVALRIRGFAARRRGRLVAETIRPTIRGAIDGAKRQQGCGTWEECQAAGWRLVRVQVRVYRGEVDAMSGNSGWRYRAP